MPIRWQILGRPGADNALLVSVDSGQSIETLLFDCGEGCLTGLRPSVIQSIDHLCFSHFHMDHVSGFDTFFRHNYNRPDAPVNVWGPAETIEVMHHRFRSFTWNLHENQPGEWIVHEIGTDETKAAQFLTREAFQTAHPRTRENHEGQTLLTGSTFRLEAELLPHHSIDSAAYRLVESDRLNIDPDALRESGFNPGAWLQQLTDPGIPDENPVEGVEESTTIGDLRRRLLIRTPGDSLAYLTDFRIEPDSSDWDSTVEWLRGTGTLVCECQYHSRDDELARRNGHMTSLLAGRLAAEAGVRTVVLHHLSRRYDRDGWQEMLDEARGAFPSAEFPVGWFGKS